MEKDEMFDDYFNKFSDLYDDPLKRGLFLLGATTYMVAQMQQKELGRMPIVDFLWGLKMPPYGFKGLVNRLQDNLFQRAKALEPNEQWRINYASEMLGKATWYLLQVTEEEAEGKLAVPEMNFYFTAGYHQANELSVYLGNKLQELKHDTELTDDKDRQE